MAEPTSTRAQLRRLIGEGLRMPFFDKFETGSTLSGTPTTATVYDSNLGESDGYWENMYLIMTGGSPIGNVRKIINFDRSTNGLALDYVLSSNPAAGDSYEIYTISPHLIHRKINQAIEESFPAFFQVIEAEEFCIARDKLEYDLSTFLTVAPWYVLQLWIETSVDRRYLVPANVTSIAAGNVVIDSAVDISDVDSNWKISVYDGAAGDVPGQFVNVASVSGQTITLAANWSTTPTASTAYLCLWNPSDEDVDWQRILAARFQPREFPSKLYFTRNYPEYEGMRVRVVYSAKPTALSSETSTTVVPSTYIKHKAINLLATDMMTDTRVDRGKWQSLASVHWELANAALRGQARIAPNTTLWQEYDSTDVGRGIIGDSSDPLGWR